MRSSAPDLASVSLAIQELSTHGAVMPLQVDHIVTSEGRLSYRARGENEPSPSAESKESWL